jgi:uncharacterized membrane protein YdbT with pleckstrin-like domain
MPSFDTETATLAGESLARTAETVYVAEEHDAVTHTEDKLVYSDTDESNTEAEQEEQQEAPEESDEEDVPPSTPRMEEPSAMLKPSTMDVLQTAYCHCSRCIKQYTESTHELFVRHPRDHHHVSYCTHLMTTLRHAVCTTVHAFFPFLFEHIDDFLEKSPQK